MGAGCAFGGGDVSWVRLDDGFPEHPKVERAGFKAAWLYVCGLAYASRQLTNGIVPRERIGKLAGLQGERKLAERLVDVGLWREHPDGYEIHDYCKHQRSRERVLKDRDESRRRMAEWRKAQAEGRA